MGSAAWTSRDSSKDVRGLYDLTKDFSQADNQAEREPGCLEAMQAKSLTVAEANNAFPIGAGIWLRIHPEDRIETPCTTWQLDATAARYS